MDESNDEEILEDSRSQGSKRMLSTEDPDYTRPPDPKRMKEMEQRAQDELRERVITVVDGVLSNAVNEKQMEMEEVDSRILRMQQCLHTLRYCVSLNYHAANKFGSNVGTGKQSYEAHPTVRKHMGKAPVSSAALSSLETNSKTSPSVSSNISKRDSQSYCRRLQDRDTNGAKGPTKGTNRESPLDLGSSENLGLSMSTGDNGQTSPRKTVDADKSMGTNLESSRPPSPKYLPPKPPDSQTIAQGRHQKFQSKRRIVVGNTYQYLTPQAGRDAEDAMRYKWQIYVRVPTEENDIASFVTDVTFILDTSYAPHHIITLKHPPFVLSRRGWGEFKVQIVLKFTDSRNKQVQLLHPLVLSRPDDPLALTGLWRLGQENWYDVWVYEGFSGDSSKVTSKEKMLDDEEIPATLEKELQNGTVSAQVEKNVTVLHGQETPSVKLETSAKILDKGGTEIKEKAPNINSNSSGASKSNAHIKVTVSEKTGLSKKDSQIKVNNIISVNKCNAVPQTLVVSDQPVKSKSGGDNNVITIKGETPSSSKTPVSNGTQSKMCKIHVRQPDGRLVPYFIPAHMYSLALKIAQMRSNTSGKSKSETEGSDTPKPSSGQTEVTVSQLLGESSKTASLAPSTEKGKSKQGEIPSVGSIKLEAFDKSLLNKKSTVIANEIKSPPGTVTEIKIPIKPKDGNIMKNHGIPVKILNVSPSKSPVILGGASTSGVQKLSIAAQGKQTLVRSGRTLSQSALLQLLSKVGVKDRSVVMQQLLSKTGLKEGVVDIASLQKVQGQLVSAQASSQGAKCNIHLMPVKIVQDKQKPKSQERQILSAASASRIVQQPIRPTNIKFVTNNGQLISTGNLTKGMMINTSVRPSTVIRPITVNNSVLTVAASGAKGTTNLKERSNIFMMPDGRILTGSSAGLQVVSSQGKNIVSQVNPLVISNTAEKGKVIQMPQVVVGSLNSNSLGVLQTATSSSPVTTTTVTTSAGKNIARTGVTVLTGGGLVTSVAPTTIRPLLKPRTVTTAGGVTSAPLVTNVSGKLTSILPLKKGVVLNTSSSEKLNLYNKVTEDAFKEQELNAQQVWEEQTRELVAVCKSFNSAEACVSLWVRALPLVSESVTDTTRPLFPYRATSSDHFLKWPLGKQRAAEFQRSREVKRWLDKCEVEGRDQWTVRRIVGWARRYAHTPIAYRQKISTDKSPATDVHNRDDITMTCFSDLEKLIEETDSRLLMPREAGSQDVDVVTIDGASSKIKAEKLPASPLKTSSEIVPWTDPDIVSGCEWVGRRASELRVTLPTEEVLPGFVADANRAIAWQAVLTFMEDLLRSSYSQAWEEKSSVPTLVPPKVISFDHVKEALVNTRPEFDLFTNDGLGAIAKDLEAT